MTLIEIFIDDEKYDLLISRIENHFNTSKSKARQILRNNIRDLVNEKYMELSNN